MRTRAYGTKYAYSYLTLEPMRTRRPHSMASFVAPNLRVLHWMLGRAPSLCVKETLIR